ncbi:MAG: transketolase C-terminal domain-containing protein [Candidatus Firestonebacteria bacterium]
MKKVTEGLKAVAETVALCRPDVISAYPITPQTHIVEELSSIVANGRLKTEFINVESEFSAASVVVGASATGARVYTATSSQGLLLMAEVLFNAAGMRLPIVMTVANRAVSAPINIWNDWQDVMTVRDSGMIQLFAEDNQEACDMHLQAYQIAENHEVMLPVVVNMDGFILTHAFDPIDFPEQADVDKFVGKYKPLEHLDVNNPLSFGLMGGPDRYLESRYAMEMAINASKPIIKKAADDFKKAFGRYNGGLIEEYQTKDAEMIIVSLGSIVSSIKDVVDELRAKGKKIGVMKIRCMRPYPGEEIVNCLKNAKKVVVIEKCISLGGPNTVTSELKSVLYSLEKKPEVSNFVLGLGGRDVKLEHLRSIIEKAEKGVRDNEFIGLDQKLVEEMDK